MLAAAAFCRHFEGCLYYLVGACLHHKRHCRRGRSSAAAAAAAGPAAETSSPGPPILQVVLAPPELHWQTLREPGNDGSLSGGWAGGALRKELPCPPIMVCWSMADSLCKQALEWPATLGRPAATGHSCTQPCCTGALPCTQVRFGHRCTPSRPFPWTSVASSRTGE